MKCANFATPSCVILFVSLLELLQLAATTFLRVVAQVLLVGVEPVAPARQLVEVALLVALVVVIEWLRCDNIMIVMGVKHMVQQTYT